MKIPIKLAWKIAEWSIVIVVITPIGILAALITIIKSFLGKK